MTPETGDVPISKDSALVTNSPDESFEAAERYSPPSSFLVVAVSKAHAATTVPRLRTALGRPEIRHRSDLRYQLGQATKPMG